MLKEKSAKLFMNGRSQAVRLPAEYRFEGIEVYIKKDPLTGNVTLARKPTSWEDFFKLLDQNDIPDDFMKERKDTKPQKRKLF
jgi:antitoxin VapB